MRFGWKPPERCLRRKASHAGVDFPNGMRTLLQLRFADDLFLRKSWKNKLVGRTGDIFGRRGTSVARAKKQKY